MPSHFVGLSWSRLNLAACFVGNLYHAQAWATPSQPRQGSSEGVGILYQPQANLPWGQPTCNPSQQCHGQYTWWFLFWQPCTLPNIFPLQWLCLKSILTITNVSQLALFLIKVFIKHELVLSERDNMLCWGQILERLWIQQTCAYHVWCLDLVNTKDFFERI